MSVSAKGFATRELYLDTLRDLDDYVEKHDIKRPVIIFIDGASPHISLEAAQFCRAKNIQPYLFRPNMTHLLQVRLNICIFMISNNDFQFSHWI